MFYSSYIFSSSEINIKFSITNVFQTKTSMWECFIWIAHSIEKCVNWHENCQFSQDANAKMLQVVTKLIVDMCKLASSLSISVVLINCKGTEVTVVWGDYHLNGVTVHWIKMSMPECPLTMRFTVGRSFGIWQHSCVLNHCADVGISCCNKQRVIMTVYWLKMLMLEWLNTVIYSGSHRTWYIWQHDSIMSQRSSGPVT